MSAASGCPEIEDLQQFLLGALPPGAGRRLEQHLPQCERCLLLAATLEGDDNLVEALRGQAATQEVEEDTVESLIGRVKRLAAQPPDEGRVTVYKVRAETCDDPSRTNQHGRARLGEDLALTGAFHDQDLAVDGLGLSSEDWLRLDGYEILGEIGHGGMGIVYKARQTRLKRLVALKMIRSGTGARPIELTRFRLEAEALARLKHPNIVQIHEVREHKGQPYFALEYVDGTSLSRRLDGTPQDPRVAARVVETLARAMEAAHRCDIVHRDLKPGNVLVGGPFDRPLDQCLIKITDFGLAKHLDREVGQTETGAVVGTPSYMAAEQAQARHAEVGPGVDIYALGAILYDLITGRPPFKAVTSLDTLQQVIHCEPVAPRQLQPQVPRDLETICLKCLQKEPARRYGSAGGLADDLARFLNNEPIQARPVGAWERGVKWARRRPVAAALFAVSAVALVSLCFAAAVYARSLVQARQLAEQELHVQKQEAQLAAQELNDLRRVEGGRVEGQKALLAGRSALAAGDLPEARNELTRVLTLAGSEPRLADIARDAAALRDEVERRQAKRQARERFQLLMDEALFLESQSTGQDPTASTEAARATARAALQLFGIDPETTGATTLDAGPFGDEEKAAVLRDSYQLLLILAGAVARPLPGEAAERQARQALGILDRAAQLHAPTRAYHLRRSACLAQLKDEPCATRERTRAAALQPTDAVDYFLLGDETFQGNDLARAALAFRKALQLQPDHWWAQYFLAICCLRSQQPDQAVLHLTACQLRQPGYVWVYLLRGLAHGELGARALAGRRTAEADQEFEAAEADFRSAGPLATTDPARYNLAVNRGVTRFRQKRLAEAVTDFQEAIRLAPRQPHAFVNLAQVYQQQKRWDEAVVQLDEAIARQPQSAALYRTRAQAHLRRPDLAAALGDLETAVRLEPAGSPLLAEDHTERGRILYQQQRYPEAVRALDAALEVRPDNALAHRLRGGALMELQRHDEAIRAFSASLKYGPESAAVYEARGLARAQRDDRVGALADYSRALGLEPNAPHLHARRGWIYLVEGTPRPALADFEEALRLEPKDGDARAGRGYARARLGQHRLAAADAEEAVRLGPRTPRHLYNVRRVFAQAVQGLDADPAQRGSLTLEPRSLYQDRALQLLRDALEQLPADQRPAFWRDHVQADDALNPIRPSVGFRQLAAQYTGQRK